LDSKFKLGYQISSSLWSPPHSSGKLRRIQR